MDMESDEGPSFVFSNPNVIAEPTQKNNSTEISFFPPANQPSIFTFSPPSSISQSVFSKPPISSQTSSETPPSDKSSKPRLSRKAFNLTLNVFNQALRENTESKQIKKKPKSPTSKCFVAHSITCTNVPKSLLAKTAAKQYFMSFGTVAKITIRPKRQSIVIYFASKNEANNALKNAGKVDGQEFNVEMTNPLTVTRKKGRSTSMSTTSSVADDQDELKSELEALSNIPNSLFEDDESSAKKVVKVKKTKAVVKEVKKVDKMDLESNIKAASIEELETILKQQANSSEDKYRILDARDKLIKLKQSKQNLEISKATVGTCPDMCPEKERLMRESQRQVSLYEQMDASEYRINHATAVKQYSRSSADQEEPLPHELRPVRSLKMTMSYLLHEIVEMCERPGTNLAEWYHFLWDRTRGIRKDITQQELCCPESVELVEQCARFHIVCSERLCAEESSVFDKKINTENLTKCLQTLKYMYHDLRLKGITCKNESEFRAYVILLNLNDSNFMWELQKLPVSVQKSAQVKFAMQVYSAIAHNNYCRFFKLVRSTTYLNAALLLRYFNQVRVNALKIMMKAYCRTPSTAFDLYELIDLLGFEDENEAIYFCEQTGLDVHQDAQDETHIIFNRHKFQLPETDLEQGRSLNIIESKRTYNNISIGECISGGRMPEPSYRDHVPHTSFDADGYLLRESLDAHDQNLNCSVSTDPYEFTEDEEMSESANTPSVPATPLGSQKPSFSFMRHSPEPVSTTNQPLHDKPRHFGHVFVEAVKNSNQQMQNINTVNIFSAQPSLHLFGEQTAVEKKIPEAKLEKPKEKSREELEREEEERRKVEEERLLLKEKRRAEERDKLLAEISEMSLQINEELLQILVEETCCDLLQTEVDHAQAQNKQSKVIYDSLLGEICKEVCATEITQEILKVRTLEEVKSRIKRRWIMKYFHMWRKFVQKRKAQYAALEDTPVWVQKRSLEECAQELYTPEQDVVLEQLRVKRFKPSAATPEKKRVPLEVLAYTALKQLLEKSDYKRIPSLFWKYVISRPDSEEDIDCWRHEYNVLNYLDVEDKEQNSTLKIFKPNSYETFYMSMKFCKGLVEREDVAGMNALVFVVSQSEDPETVDRRLSRIFYSGRKCSPIPVVIIVIGNDRGILERICLADLVAAGFISKVSVFCDNSMSEEKTITNMQIIVPWLIINMASTIPLEINCAKQVLSDCLMDILWLRVQGHAMNNSQIADIFMNSPNFIIGLHNEAVNRLTRIFLDDETLSCPEFPEEFKQFLRPNHELPYGYEYSNNEWRNVSCRNKLEEKLKNLILPTWKYPWPAADVLALSNTLKLYIKEVLPEVNYNVVAGAILSNLYLILENSIKPCFTYILSYIIEHKINDFGNELIVAYNKDRLKYFKSYPWWFKTDIYLTLQEQSLSEITSAPEESQSLERHSSDSDITDYTSDLTEMNETFETFSEKKDEVDKIISLSMDVNQKCNQLQLKMKKLEEVMKKALQM